MTSFVHQVAYEREALTWERLERLKALNPGHSESDPDLLAPAQTVSVVRSRTRPIGLPVWAAIAASIVVTASIAAGAIFSASPAVAYASALGQQRLVHLADGSTIDLNTDSEVVVHYDHGVRTARLVRGEAVFHVAPGRRLFSIKAPSARIDLQDAVLAVRLDGPETVVRLVQGVALVGSTAQTSALALNSQSEVRIGASPPRVRTVSPEELDRTLAWEHGGIALQGETLDSAAHEFNRYNARKIIVSDAATRSLQVGGYFNAHDIGGFTRAVSAALPVRASLTAAGNIVLSHRD